MPATLVVVDMQPDFEAACCLDAVVGVTEQIIYAKHHKWPIVLVEYEGCGATHDAIVKLLKGYKNKARISKCDDDGSREVIRCLQRRSFPRHHLRVCGVNADCCVYLTVEGLLDRLESSLIELAKSACATEYGIVDWRRYLKHPRLKLV